MLPALPVTAAAPGSTTSRHLIQGDVQPELKQHFTMFCIFACIHLFFLSFFLSFIHAYIQSYAFIV